MLFCHSLADDATHTLELIVTSGWRQKRQRDPDGKHTEHTMYSLASVSKTVTATGLMVLVERGRIDLDRPINDYLGEAKLKA